MVALDPAAKQKVVMDICAVLSPTASAMETTSSTMETTATAMETTATKMEARTTTADNIEFEEKEVFMYNEPPPLPSDHVQNKKNQVTLSEAWKRKATVSVTRKSKARTDELYNFVYSTIYCATCFPDYGQFRISVGDDRYNKACLGNKWFDTEFIASFVTLLGHDAHVDTPPFMGVLNLVKIITCHFPKAVVMEHQVKALDKTVTTLLLVAFSSSHFAVLEFNVHKRTVSVFDGLNQNINNWVDHVIHTLREYGLVHLTVIPKCSYTTEKQGKSVMQRLEVRFGKEATWIVENTVFVRQKDGHNCGPIACSKVMQVLGFVDEDRIKVIEGIPGGFRKLVMHKYNELIVKYNDSLLVDFRTREDGDGVAVAEDICICGDTSEQEGLYTLECCGRKVHIECLSIYLQTVPFCMYCSRSLSSMYDSLPERTLSQQTLSQQTLSLPVPEDTMSELMQLIMGGDNEVPPATTLDETATSTLSTTTVIAVAAKDNPVTSEHKTSEDKDNNDEDDDNNKDVVAATTPTAAIAVGTNETATETTMEDINRSTANRKKRNMQESSAQKEMKRRCDELISEGLGVGAVVTCKVDYRTHSHAEGLVCIVYKCSDYGAAIVCCENGVLTHDGSKKDYYVPSDKFVIKAGAEEEAVIPEELQKVRKDIMEGKYDYDNMPRISYSKQHQQSISATSPCKRAVCSCKGGCNSRCGCRKKNLDCTSTCACSGNCNWRATK